MGCLVNLSSLKVDHNALTCIGEEVGQMVHLEELVSIIYQSKPGSIHLRDPYPMAKTDRLVSTGTYSVNEDLLFKHQ